MSLQLRTRLSVRGNLFRFCPYCLAEFYLNNGLLKTTYCYFAGCLWAMNPSKVGKMDEEVQKWSRKDPQAIKKAMVYPGS